MSQLDNTLFIIAEFGLKSISKNIFESHMWILSQYEESMKYISLHYAKKQPSYEGGEIIEIRLATDLEIEFHQ